MHTYYKWSYMVCDQNVLFLVVKHPNAEPYFSYNLIN